MPVNQNVMFCAYVYEHVLIYKKQAKVTIISQKKKYFDKKIAGFAHDDAVIAAVESRTSSPVRIVRDELFESNIKGIYPCGEGAGYAGGIVSSALDGINCASKI